MFFASTISKCQNSKIPRFQNSGRHSAPQMVNAPESTCHCGVTSTVVRDPSRAPSARRELPEKKEPLSFLGKAVPSIF